MRAIKSIIGIVMVLAALGGIIYWETTGREEATTEEVLAAACKIEEGAVIEESMIKTIAVLTENMMKSVARPGEESLLVGRIAGGELLENQQLSAKHIKNMKYSMENGYAPYTIKKEWISNISSAVRKGDTILIYDKTGELLLGEYKVAFVKDSSDQEIVDIELPNAKKEILERTASNGVIDHLEIQATLAEYKAIFACIEETGEGLLFVHKGANVEGVMDSE